MAKRSIKNPKCTAEELEALNFERLISKLREQPIRNPTVKYEVGEEVKFSGFTKSIVTDILDNGEIYILECTETKNRFGNEETALHKRCCAWFEIFKCNEQLKDVQIVHTKNNLQISYFQQDIGSLLNRYYQLGVIMNPEYQRDLVWSEEQEQSLLDSIFNDNDIGKFSFIHIPYDANIRERYEILDGKQRLNTIIKFNEGRIKYKGKTIFEMHPFDRYYFESKSISVGETQNVTRKQVYEHFIKLNTSGIPMASEHINKVKQLFENEN